MKCHPHAVRLLSLIVGFSGVASAQAPLPPAVVTMQRKFHRAMETAAAPIRERYLENLTKLQDQLTRSGQPEAALAVKAQINLTLLQPMLGRWNDAAGDGILDMRQDGTTVHSNGSQGTWELRDNLLCIVWRNGWKHEFPLAEAGPLLSGKLINPSGEERTFLESRPNGD